MSKIVHLMHHDKFIKPYIEFINNKFDKHEHVFFLSGGVRYQETYIHNNVIQLYPRKKKIGISTIINDLKLLYFVVQILVSKKIIIHGLFNEQFIRLLYNYKRVLRKSNWIIWGGDLYNSYLDDDIEKIKAYLIQNLHSATGIDGDIAYAREKYRFNGIQHKAYYINPIKFNSQILKSNIGSEPSKTTILVGNSANPTNRHIDIFSVLERFKDFNVSIITPLTYGSDDYREHVIRYGKSIFGEKFIPICDHMQPAEYLKLLEKIDIAIFYFNRQQGIHTINALFALGKKVYIPRNISIWDFYSNDVLLKPEDYNTLRTVKFEELTINDNSEDNSKKALKFFFSEDNLVAEWKKVFFPI